MEGINNKTSEDQLKTTVTFEEPYMTMKRKRLHLLIVIVLDCLFGTESLSCMHKSQQDPNKQAPFIDVVSILSIYFT